MLPSERSKHCELNQATRTQHLKYKDWDWTSEPSMYSMELSECIQGSQTVQFKQVKLQREISSQLRKSFEPRGCYMHTLFIAHRTNACGAEHISLADQGWRIKINSYVRVARSLIP